MRKINEGKSDQYKSVVWLGRKFDGMGGYSHPRLKVEVSRLLNNREKYEGVEIPEDIFENLKAAYWDDDFDTMAANVKALAQYQVVEGAAGSTVESDRKLLEGLVRKYGAEDVKTFIHRL